jgi:DeoR/GlpR family transcriptional regulator of sugar metabolism
MSVKSLARQRRNEIINTLRDKGVVRVSELSRYFNVSVVTIRSDLRHLEKIGILRREHGGAIGNIGTNLDVTFAARLVINQVEKRRIAAAAIDLIKSGDTISIDAGTTTMEIARQLPGDLAVSVITNGPNIAMEVAAREKVTVELAGGLLSPDHIAVLGSGTENIIKDYYTNNAFIAILAFDLDRGMTDTSLAVARVKRAFLENTERAIVVADSSKFRQIASVFVAHLDSINTLITDTDLSDEDTDRISSLGVEVIRV